MKKQIFYVIFLFWLFIFGFNPSQSNASSTLYDDFQKPYIDPNKWSNFELVNEIQDGKLYSETVAYGIRSKNELNFKNPNPINYIEADVTVKKFEGNLGGGGISNYAFPNVALTGFFYNDGSASGPNSLKGEVQGSIMIGPYDGKLWVYWCVYKSKNDEGTEWTSSTNRFPNPASLNATYKLSIQFEPSSKTFTFKVGSDIRTWISTDTINPPNIPWKTIRTDANFVGTGTGLYGKIAATFDNVIAKDELGNVVVSDDFSSSTIDPSKWRYSVRKISDGKLLSKVNTNSDTRNSLSFKNPEQIKELQAKVTLLEFNNPDEAFTRARLGGQFYNDTGNPNSGWEGDVWAEVVIGGIETDPSAGWVVVRYNDAKGTNTTTLGHGTFPITINLGETYDLFLGWDGSTFTFKCNDNIATYTPVTNKFSPNYKWKQLDTRVSHLSQQPFETYVSATFDDVRINGPVLSPAEGTIGTEISITSSEFGFGFGTKKGKVLIGNTPLTVIDWTDGLIHCRLTKVLDIGTYDVTILPNGEGAFPIVEKDAFTIRPAEIYSIEEGYGSAYDQVTIQGKFFGTKKGKVYLEYGEAENLIRKNCKVLSWKMDPPTGDSTIIFVIPKMLPEVCDVVVDPYSSIPEIGEEDGFMVKAPEIEAITPGSGSPGESITISGNYFGSKKGKVFLGYTDAKTSKYIKKSCSISSWSGEEIVFIVPKLPPGSYDVTITNSVWSDTYAGFTIK
jgi:hypothetical protein